MARVPCPRCSAPVEDGQEACPYCRRPLTAAERRTASETGGRGVPGVLTAAATAAALAAAALLVYRSRAGIAEGAKTAAVGASIAAGLLGTRTAEAPVAPPDAATQPLGERMISGPCRVPAAREPATPPGDARAVSGIVYDMVSGCAVAGAVVALSGPSGQTGISARTDADGYYETSFPKIVEARGELTLSVSAAGYRPGQADESDPPYRERSAQDRRAAAASVSDDDLGPQPLRYPSSAGEIRQDLVLVPAAR